MTQSDQSPRPAQSALTPTGGFLTGFTHTLQPYIGCRFACEYCYVKGLVVHRFHRPHLPWGDYAHPRMGIAEHLKRELATLARKGKLAELSIFMSSATDPYQGLERKWRLSRQCLEVMVKYLPRLLILQTRSPLVQDDFALLRRLGERCWLNFTLETDLDAVRQAVTLRCPSIQSRLAALRAAVDFGLNVQITVSPCLPYSDVETFGQLLLSHSQRVIINTYKNDGQHGKRTAATAIPGLYQAQGWPDWQEAQAALDLHQWLSEHIGIRVGWSQEGFTVLARQATP